MMKVSLIFLMIFSFVSVMFADGLEAKKDERDLMCGIQPYKNPRWMSEIELSNGKKLHSVSVKCMMLFYYKNDKWDDLGIKDSKNAIKALRVQDYNSLKVIDAKKAYYVFGGHIMGPKGDDLIPFQYEKDAQNFLKENGGHRILTWKHFKLNLFDLLNL